jgi:hypothetical protein
MRKIATFAALYLDAEYREISVACYTRRSQRVSWHAGCGNYDGMLLTRLSFPMPCVAGAYDGLCDVRAAAAAAY